MYAINKKNLKTFTPRSEDVCRIENGSTNAYLRENRAVEEFLNTFEPKHNDAVARLARNRIDRECIYTIAGFVAYVISCSPTGMQLHSSALQGAVEMEAFLLDRQGLIPIPPPELGGINLTEILNKGIAKVDADQKFPQAIGAASILNNTAIFGNFRWELLLNDFEDGTYFTSDYPVAIEPTNDPSVRNRIVPLSPGLAIRIRPDRGVNTRQVDFTFANFICHSKRLCRREVEQINKQLVQCAEELVFFRDNHPWVPGFIRRNSRFCVELRTHKVKHGARIIMFCGQDIVKTPNDENLLHSGSA